MSRAVAETLARSFGVATLVVVLGACATGGSDRAAEPARTAAPGALEGPPPQLALPDTAFPEDTVTVTWERLPVGTDLYWVHNILGFGLIGGAGDVDRISGSRSVRVPWPSLGSSVKLGAYRDCFEIGFGPFRRTECVGELASAVIGLRGPEITVRPALAYPGQGAFVTFDHAPVGAELWIKSSLSGPWAPARMHIGTVPGRAAGADFSERTVASGEVGFWTPEYFSAERIELRQPCRGLQCTLAPSLVWRLFASTPFSVGAPELEVTPDEARIGDTVVVSAEHAPADAVVARDHSGVTGFGHSFAHGVSSSGTRVTIARDLEVGDHTLSLHARCEFSVVLVIHFANCSPTLATVRLTIVDEEAIGRASAEPTGILVARPTLGAASSAPALPVATAPARSTDPVPTPSPTTLVTLASPATAVAPTPAPTPIAASLAPLQATAPTFAPSPTPTSSPTPTPAPTIRSTLLPIVTASPVPTVQPTVTPTKTPTPPPTQKPNTPPQITKIGDQSGKAGQQFVIGVSASDADGDKIALTCGGADKFTDHGDGTGTFVWTGTKAGTYTFTCSASDGKASTSTSFAITLG
jgi:hypothetical protein